MTKYLWLAIQIILTLILTSLWLCALVELWAEELPQNYQEAQALIYKHKIKGERMHESYFLLWPPRNAGEYYNVPGMPVNLDAAVRDKRTSGASPSGLLPYPSNSGARPDASIALNTNEYGVLVDLVKSLPEFHLARDYANEPKMSANSFEPWVSQQEIAQYLTPIREAKK